MAARSGAQPRWRSASKPQAQAVWIQIWSSFRKLFSTVTVRVDRAMTSWEEYHELLARLETEQAQREASEEAPSEDLVQSIKTHLTETPSNSLLGPLTEADARTDSPLCALPDDTRCRRTATRAVLASVRESENPRTNSPQVQAYSTLFFSFSHNNSYT